MGWDLVVPLAGMATGVILFLPLVRAGVRALERKTGGALSEGDVSEMKEALRHLHERLDAFESDVARVQELEERLDFAERVLAQQTRPKLEKPSVSEVPT